MNVTIEELDICSISPSDRVMVDQVLERAPGATVFHTIEWNEILTTEFGLQTTMLLATVGGEPAGLFTFFTDGRQCESPIPRFESVYGGPISTGDERTVLALLRQAERMNKGAHFSIWTPVHYDVSPLQRMGYTVRQDRTSILNLQGSEEALWTGLKATARNRVRKARNAKIEVVEGDVSLVPEYYEMVLDTLATRAQIQALPERFYEHVVQHLGAKGLARFLLARQNGTYIGGAIFLCFKDTVYYWHGASRRERPAIGHNDLIFWELITWAREHGFRYFDLVRIEEDRLPGIARFKLKFGGDMVAFHNLQKATWEYRLWRVLRIAGDPRRLRTRILDRVARIDHRD